LNLRRILRRPHLPDNTNPDRSLVQKPGEESRVGAGDIFDKAFSFTRADEAMEAGVYPYFKPISSHNGGTVIVDGREMVITGSND
jgi:8-amino-7-oxononanoate synthase